MSLIKKGQLIRDALAEQLERYEPGEFIKSTDLFNALKDIAQRDQVLCHLQSFVGISIRNTDYEKALIVFQKIED